MPSKPACNGDTKSCQWSSCSPGVCALDGVLLPVPENCRGCGNLSVTVGCSVCWAIDTRVKPVVPKERM